MRRALVTGGSGELGAALCRRLARDGHHVLVHGHRHPERARSVADAINANGGTAEAVAFDITDHDAVARALDPVLAAGPIDVLVHNAGLHADALMAAMTVEQWRSVIDVCLNGFFNVTQPLILPMARARWGRILAISSVAGVLGNRGQTNYAAAKAGLHGATKALALELASRRITVNAVAPGIVAGRATETHFDDAALRRLVPLARAAEAEEVAALVAFLASEEAGYITGQVLHVNGGMAG